MLARHDLTDAEWALLEPLLPDPTPRRGGRWADHRQVLKGVFWRTRCGVPWRDMPACFGLWKTVYNRHRRWSADATWERILDELRCDADRAEGEEWTVALQLRNPSSARVLEGEDAMAAADGEASASANRLFIAWTDVGARTTGRLFNRPATSASR